MDVSLRELKNLVDAWAREHEVSRDKALWQLAAQALGYSLTTPIIVLVAACVGDQVPGHELADPECTNIADVALRPDVSAFMRKHEYGPEYPDNLIYVVTGDDIDRIPDGFPTLTLRI